MFTKNRDRVLAGEVATAFFTQVLAQAKAPPLLSDEHFTVDGTLIGAWAGQKSFKKTASAPPSTDAPGTPRVDFRGERRTNATHASTTDPEARLYKQATGQETQLGFLEHGLMENRHGVVVNTRLTPATGTAERKAALALGLAGPPHNGSRWVATRTTIPRRSSRICGRCECRPTSLSRRETESVRLMAEPHDLPTMPSVNRSANESKRSWAG